MEEKIITSIGNFEAIEILRKVPEGVLYKAVEKNTQDHVLIKIYYPSLVWSEDILNEFFNLISYLRFIEHNNLLPISDVGKYEGLPYVVFPGDSTTLLRDRQNPPTTRKELLDFFYKIADALDYLHKQEILHGILNTENIIIDSNGEPKMFDHGLSGIFKKLLLENLEDGFDNLSVSDLRCTSPEQILGRAPTRTSDIYSFGMVFYYYALGDFPFSGKSDPDTAVSLLESMPVQVSNIPDHVSGDILRFIQKCIQVEPNARFTSFTQALKVLERLQAGKWVRLQFKKRIKTERKLPRYTFRYTIGILLMAGLFAVYYFYPRNTEASPPAPPTVAATAQTESIIPASEMTEASIPPANEQSTQEPVTTEEASAPPVQIQPLSKPAMEMDKPDKPIQVISLSNVGNIREFDRLGYGKPEQADASPNNQYFAVASSAGVFIFSGASYLNWIDPEDWATSVQFSTDNNILAIGVKSGDIQLWDWKNESKIATLKRHKAKITKIIFSSNDRLLYSASQDQHVIVWDLNQQSSIQDITAHSAPVNDIAVSTDGRTLVSCSDDQLIRIWDIASGRKIYELRFEGKPKAVAVSSDNAYFAAGGDRGFIRQWPLIDARSLTTTTLLPRTDAIPVKSRIWSLDYIENDTKLLAGIDDGNSKTYSASQLEYKGVSLGFIIEPPLKDLVDIFGPKFGFESFSTIYQGNIVSLNWDGGVTAGGKELIQPVYDILDRLDFSPDGNILASGGRRKTTNVWNLNTNQVLFRSQNELPFGNPIAPNGSSLVVLVSKTARITQTGEYIIEESYKQVSLSGTSVVGELSEAIPNSNVSYARNGTVLISGSLVASKSWDYGSGFETFSSGRSSIAGCFVTTSNNDNEILQIMSAAGILPTADDRAKNICAKSSQTNLPAASGDLRLLAYVNSSGLVEGYDTSTKLSLWRFRTDSRVLALAVSPDGTIVVAGGENGKITFINGQNGELLNEITGNFGAVRAIKFSEDGTKLATVGDDGTTRLFGITSTDK
jgi:WD40 repeat protein